MSERVDIEQYTERFSEDVASLILGLRSFILELVPNADERFRWSHPWYELGGSFAYVMGFSEHVNLGFPRGVELVEQYPILEGTGKGMRHVKIHAPSDLDDPAITSLVKAAVRLNSVDM